MTQDTVYLNGEYLPADEARISVLDRGFIFGDGIYEVIPVYGGRLFRLPHHLQRLDNSLAAIKMVNPLPHEQWRTILQTIVEKNGGGDQSVYMQITRGVAKRDHAFPKNVNPTVFVMSTPLTPPAPHTQNGIEAITVEDIRWRWCHIKSIALLPNILLRQQAVEQEASEAIMIRDGAVTEGAAANIFMVKNGIAITPPHSHLLLPGITRDLVVELCQRHHIACEERPIRESEFRDADEIWVTSSTKEVVPVVRLDGVPVADGKPGPLWQTMIEYYRQYKEAFKAGDVESDE